MKALTFSIVCCLAVVMSGCKAKPVFEPQWLPKTARITYCTDYEGNIRVKLKARATESDFAAASAALQLVSHAEDKEYTQHTDLLAWKKGPDLQWDPSPKSDGNMISHHYNLWE